MPCCGFCLTKMAACCGFNSWVNIFPRSVLVSNPTAKVLHTHAPTQHIHCPGLDMIHRKMIDRIGLMLQDRIISFFIGTAQTVSVPGFLCQTIHWIRWNPTKCVIMDHNLNGTENTSLLAFSRWPGYEHLSGTKQKHVMSTLCCYSLNGTISTSHM